MVQFNFGPAYLTVFCGIFSRKKLTEFSALISILPSSNEKLKQIIIQTKALASESSTDVNDFTLSNQYVT